MSRQTRLILVLGDQLSPDLSALREGDRATDIVVMAEVRAEAIYVRHHPKKIAFIFAAMRKFAAELRADGWTVAYTAYDDPGNAGSIPGELLRRAEQAGATEVLATEPGEWRLIEALETAPLPVHQFADTRFFASHAEFEDWAGARRDLTMEYFYRRMRRKTGYLMEGDRPVGGRWNLDKENRKPAPRGAAFSAPMQFIPDETVEGVLTLVETRFPDNFGTLRPFRFATDRAQARRALAHFVRTALPDFGTWQDAMIAGDAFVAHSALSLYMNAGLLDPAEVCDAVHAAWAAGGVPLNAAEGFIRQVIGWREFVRGIYFREGPDYPARNVLDHRRDLPAFYWTADTDMACLAGAIATTRDEAYSHHIQRLMVTGNFALLAGVEPRQVHEWYLEVYADAYEWVEAPNTIGMSQFADGGLVATKPYVSSGAYIDRMSDYCGSCAYSVKRKTGQGACPFNLLFWHVLDRHRARFETNPRMAAMYRTWDRMDPDRRDTVLRDARRFLDRLDAGQRV